MKYKQDHPLLDSEPSQPARVEGIEIELDDLNILSSESQPARVEGIEILLLLLFDLKLWSQPARVEGIEMSLLSSVGLNEASLNPRGLRGSKWHGVGAGFA